MQFAITVIFLKLSRKFWLMGFFSQLIILLQFFGTFWAKNSIIEPHCYFTRLILNPIWTRATDKLYTSKNSLEDNQQQSCLAPITQMPQG